ncbi:MFS general substrate transporter [Aspergillus taichungensis]|uniref:MFS general substrate transporter n=1 Tax=Aspergillus taichungensis TaxID=482145 RepID=A0A2J5HWM8_9EURO|nr:MFS general substrate transporter [Aspergillus taichungensis]
MERDHSPDQNIISCAPGTVLLEDRTRGDEIVLFPTPSEDPNDPLNWSPGRKSVNLGLVCFFVLWTFVELDIAFTAWGPMQSELGFTIDQLNAGAAVNYGGLAIGCIFFVPLVHKYGRRPVYIASTALQFASCIWQARTTTVGDLIGCNLVSGVGSAISEIIVQITIADLYFVHQHATMNAYFVLFQCIGTFLGPVAAGYIIVSQGWRWMWWWCVIFLGVTLVCVILFFEESKYVPVLNSREVTSTSSRVQNHIPKGKDETEILQKPAGDNDTLRNSPPTDHIPRPKSYRQRLALYTKTDESLLPYFRQPIIALFTFPAVAYTAITYGTTLAWFAIFTSIQATYLIEPPYRFDATGVGLMNVAPFIGGVVGFFLGGYLSDRMIVLLSKRNGGIYEPEMRLWLALPVAVTNPASLLMLGLGLAYESHWSVIAVGYGIFGFGFAIISETTLSYLMDSYQDIIGDALVGVIFTRNILSVIVLFVLTPWVNGMHMQNTHILIAVLCFVVLLLPVPLLLWGKKARVSTASRYRRMAANQPTHRAA